MAITYPTTLDSFTTIGATDTEATVLADGRAHRAEHNDANAAIVAIETELGTLPKGGSATVKARIIATETVANAALPKAGGTMTGAIVLTAVRVAYAAKTSAYTVVATTDYALNGTTGTWAFTLPTAVSDAGRIFVLTNTGTGTITINTTSSQTVSGAASGATALAQYDSITVLSDGANWIIT